MDEGRTKFSSIWIHNVHRSYSSQGTQNSASRGLAEGNELKLSSHCIGTLLIE